MSVNLMISKIYCNFIVLKHKTLQTKIAMIIEDKIFASSRDFRNILYGRRFESSAPLFILC